MNTVLKSLHRHYPFTAAGSAVVCIGIILNARGRATSDVYQLLIGIAAILVPLLITVLSRVQAVVFDRQDSTWTVHPELTSTMLRPRTEHDLALTANAIRSWMFFRIHVRVRGMLRSSESVRYHVHEEQTAIHANPLKVFLNLPFAGTLQIRASAEVRDVFGLTRASFGTTHRQHSCVAPDMPTKPHLTRPDMSTGTTETSRTANPDETRYYMREYVAGDRVRDINWKASQRLRSLITRISPETRDRDTSITIYLRHFGNPDHDSALATAHMTYLSGWLLSFVATVLTQQDGCRFHVITGNGSYDVSSISDVAGLSQNLCGVSLVPEPPQLPVRSEDSLIVVFTTPFDVSLDNAVNRLRPVPVRIFSTAHETPSGRAELEASDIYFANFDYRLIPCTSRSIRYLNPGQNQAGADSLQILEEIALHRRSNA